MSECHENKKFSTKYIGDIPVYNLEKTPDYFLVEVDVEDPESGNIVRSPARIPGDTVMPTGNMANVLALPTNNTELVVPKGQVRAGYINNQPGGNIMEYADASHKAVFLMVGDWGNGQMLVQSTGFLRVPEGHNYIVGSQYYTGENGEPVTDSTSGQKLFVPVSNSVLMINMG